MVKFFWKRAVKKAGVKRQFQAKGRVSTEGVGGGVKELGGGVV